MSGLRSRSAAILVGVCAFLVAGCGGSDAEGGEAGTSGLSSFGEDKATAPAAKSVNVKTNKAPPAKTEAKSAFGTATLAYPDDFQMTLLAYRLTDRQPPLADWAAEAYDVRTADEFSKSNKLEAEVARLSDIYASTDGVGILQIRLNSQISQYDPGRGGYYLTAFSPGNQMNFTGKENVSVQLENMASGFFWPVEAARAQEILQHTNRSVDIDTKVQIIGIQRRSSGLVIQGRILEYGIYSKRYADGRQFDFFKLD